MGEKKFKCSTCGTVYDYNSRNKQNIYGTLIMYCPKDKGVCWPYEDKEFFELKNSLLERYSKEELWGILEKMRADKLIVDNKEFKIKEEGED